MDQTTRQRGAQPGNVNALRTATRAVRLELGTLPKPMIRCERTANHFRRLLEGAAVERHGEITVTMALAINTAARHERHAQVCLHLLRNAADLTTDQKASLSREIAKASAARDVAVRELRLDQTSNDSLRDELRAYYTSSAEPTDQTDQPAATDAADEATASDVAHNTEGPTDGA